jgi:hypothetical protein
LKTKKLAVAILVIILSSTLLSAQNLAEVAKKEKARRAALRAQGKISILVTNADLKKRKKLPVVSASASSSTPARNEQSVANPRAIPNLPPRAPKIPGSQQEVRRRDQSPDGYRNRDYATNVLLSSELVKNPEYALKKPDGEFAELSLQGVLELEVNCKNGPGPDIAVYAKISGSLETTSGGEEEGGIPETLGVDLHEGVWYGILAMDKNGEWEALGRGRGRSGSEKFDLGRISSTKKIRIIFKPFVVPDIPVKYVRSQSRELSCGIDAIEVLN